MTPSKAPARRPGAAGITVAESLREVAEKSDDAIVSMVRDYAQNVDVILGEGGLLLSRTQERDHHRYEHAGPGHYERTGWQVEETATRSSSPQPSAAAPPAPRPARSRSWPPVRRTWSPPPGRTSTAVAPTRSTTAASPATARPRKLVNNLVLGITMNAVAEGLKFGAQYDLPESELLNLFTVSHRRQLGCPELGLRLRVDRGHRPGRPAQGPQGCAPVGPRAQRGHALQRPLLHAAV